MRLSRAPEEGASNRCPHCLAYHCRVLSTRSTSDGSIHRRRLCLSCRGRWSTKEYVVVEYRTALAAPGSIRFLSHPGDESFTERLGDP